MSQIQSDLGSVQSLWRYPVKSMMGKELTIADVEKLGIVGDRAYALVAEVDGKVASAKNPGKWPTLFAFRAGFLRPPGNGGKIPPVRITMPDGATVTSEQQDLNQTLSKVLGKEVVLAVTEGGQVAGVQSSMPTPVGLQRLKNIGRILMAAIIAIRSPISRCRPALFSTARSSILSPPLR